MGVIYGPRLCQVRIPRTFFSPVRQPALFQKRILPPPGLQSKDESEQSPQPTHNEHAA